MNHLNDTFKHKGMRKNLISQLQEKGIGNQDILEAFDLIPKHYFLDLAFEEQAYSNMAFQIGSNQFEFIRAKDECSCFGINVKLEVLSLLRINRYVSK
jgi:hypothetical protein